MIRQPTPVVNPNASIDSVVTFHILTPCGFRMGFTTPSIMPITRGAKQIAGTRVDGTNTKSPFIAGAVTASIGGMEANTQLISINAVMRRACTC